MRLHAIKSFYDNQAGGLVTLEDDVLSIVSQVQEISDGRISINLDPDTGWFHLVEHCEDTTDRLVFSVSELDGRVVERLRKADSRWAGFEDPYDAAEREQDENHALIERAQVDQVLQSGEELLFYIHRDGKAPRLPTQVFMPRGVHANR